MCNSEHIRTVDRLRTGDRLEISLPDDEALCIPPSDLPLNVEYEDEDVIVLNKPPFMPVHPTHNHQGDTLANALSGYLLKKGKACAFRAVNRLDRDTSGLVVIGLNTYSACRLSNGVEKEYYAIVHGFLEGSGTIDLPIRRVDPLKIHREVSEDGERAVTHWRAVASDGLLTLLAVRLETGRTHQIRVHFSHLGHPLAGESLYAQPDGLLGRQALHCKNVSFRSPVTNEAIHVSTAFPEDMQKLIRQIEKNKI